MRHFDVVIVGGGHGGAQTAIALRQHKFVGSIAIVSDESELPYERPPLSKEYLAGEKSFERILLRPPVFWDDRAVTMILGSAVVTADASSHTVELRTGETLSYGKLVWAAGGVPRRLSCEGADLQGVHAVRTRSDIDRIVADLQTVDRVAVVGGGYIGLEAAAVLRKLGKEVTLLEALDRVLARVAGEPLSRFYEEEHRTHGVDLRTGVAVGAIEGENGHTTGVRLADGDFVSAGMVIVGIGISPAVDPLLAAGAAGANGVDVDQFCRTNLPDVFAIGDCAAHENAFAGNARIRIESVQNANDQATTAARAIVGDDQPYHAVPWFWSNQYDLKLQTVGLSMGYDDVVIRGDLAARSFSVVYLRAGRVVALDCVNAVKDFVQGRVLVETRSTPSKLDLADVATPLKSLR